MLKIPYECPKCKNYQWVEVENEYFGGSKVVCNECEHEDSLEGPRWEDTHGIGTGR